MDNECTVQVTLELGHHAQLRKKPTSDGSTHNWMVFVCGSGQSDIQHFVEKVVFMLPDDFPKRKRVCKKPPYKVEECGSDGFILPIEIYFKRQEEPKKVCFTYDLFLNLEGNSPVNHLRCEKLTFKNPTKEFHVKLLKARGSKLEKRETSPSTAPSERSPKMNVVAHLSSEQSRKRTHEQINKTNELAHQDE